MKFEFAPTDDPETMDHAEIREEYRDLTERRVHGALPDEQADRMLALWTELKSRSDTEEPECPECGVRRWGWSPGEPIACMKCDLTLGENHEELIEDVENAWNAIVAGSEGSA